MMTVINATLLFNLLLIVATVLSWLAFRWVTAFSYRGMLRFNYILFLGVVVSCLAATVISFQEVRVLEIDANISISQKGKFLVPQATEPIRLAPTTATKVKNVFAVVLALILLGYLLFFGRELLKLGRAVFSSYPYKQNGRVRVRFSEYVDSPFSAWWPFRHYIILPYALASSPRKMRLCVAHEIQHHRQNDTRWVYLFMTTKIVFFVNPAIHIWSRIVNEVQEFSCDEVLLGRKNFAREEYISCLIEVAENSLKRKQRFVCATSLGFVRGQNLKRRIQFMLKDRVKIKCKNCMLAVTLSAIALITATAFACKATFEEPRTIVEDGSFSKSYQNTEIIRTLNLMLDTPEKKARLRQSLKRLEGLRPELEKMCTGDCDIRDFLAIGLIESGYENLPPHEGDFERSAGIWQIIGSTGRMLGLRVDAEKDERRDVFKSAAAAIKYLKLNADRFKSWDLSVLAYNSGENAVSKAIEKTGSANPWAVRLGLHNETQNYYLRWLAAKIILDNPKIVLIDASHVYFDGESE